MIPPSYDEPGAGVQPLTLSLLHEIAHAEQSDPWFGMVANLAQTVWFLLPPVWWIRSRLLMDQEFLADRRAALRYGTSSGYAASLLLLAESQFDEAAASRLDSSGPVWPSGQETDAGSPLFQRMLMLLHCPFRVEPRVSRTWSWGVRLSVIAVSIAAASVTMHWPGAATNWRGQADEMELASQPFQVADFVAEPMVFLPGGRALPYIMPVSLPSHFELTVEILSNVTELAKVYIAGHPLASLPLQPLISDLSADSPDHGDSWHQVRLERQWPGADALGRRPKNSRRARPGRHHGMAHVRAQPAPPRSLPQPHRRVVNRPSRPRPIGSAAIPQSTHCHNGMWLIKACHCRRSAVPLWQRPQGPGPAFSRDPRACC